MYCESQNLPVCAAGGVLSGEVVLAAVRGQHMGAEGRCGPD